MERLRAVLNVFHITICTIVTAYLHYFIPVVIPDKFPRLIYPIHDLYYDLAPLSTIFTSIVFSYLYMRLVRAPSPFKKAIISVITGTVLFWASCIGILCAIAPALRNM